MINQNTINTLIKVGLISTTQPKGVQTSNVSFGVVHCNANAQVGWTTSYSIACPYEVLQGNEMETIRSARESKTWIWCSEQINTKHHCNWVSLEWLWLDGLSVIEMRMKIKHKNKFILWLYFMTQTFNDQFNG